MAKNKENKKDSGKINTKAEAGYVTKIINQQTEAEAGKRKEAEDRWDDEYLGFKGDQWDMSIAPRSKDSKSKRPNSVSNFILPTIKNIHDGLTTSVPEGRFEGRRDENDIMADKLTDVVAFVLYNNDYKKQWKDTVLQGLKHGPFIGAVLWDPHMEGGAGPSAWQGEVLVINQKKEEIFFDPAIIDLEERMQECEFINRKRRKKLTWIADRFEKGKHVESDEDFISGMDEGMNAKQASIIENWHKGTPWEIPKYWKDRFTELAEKAKKEEKLYKMQDYLDKAEGIFKGVHCCFTAGTVFLEYIPYIFDDGLYPFILRVLYQDERNPLGFGEEANILMPQVMYNKADEIEAEAMTAEGLGGYFAEEGAMSRPQLNEYKRNAHKGGWIQRVLNIDRMKPRVKTNTPQSSLLYKDKKKETMDIITQNTAIRQGISPGANVPNATIRDLGARADIRDKGKLDILDSFLTEMFQRILSRLAQFYDADREYRILGNKSGVVKTLIFEALEKVSQITDPQEKLSAVIELIETMENMNKENTQRFGTFNNTEMFETQKRDGILEDYVPEYDIKVIVTDEKPTSRQYYEQMAMALLGKGMGPKAFWKTIEDGKFPPTDEILQELQDMVSAQTVVEQPAAQGDT